MSKKGDAKRLRLVSTAAGLVHGQGFYRTTLADVATAADVPLGNLYYYFKTKEDIGSAIASQYVDQFTSMTLAWAQMPDPRARLCAYIEMSIDTREIVAINGCPIGSLCGETNKAMNPLGKLTAEIFSRILLWMEAQFLELGIGADAHGRAVRLLSAIQGATLLAQCFHDPELIERQAKFLQEQVRLLSLAQPSKG